MDALRLVEAVTKSGTLAFYEAYIGTRGSVREVKVSADGQPL